jgi:hypothetical protein
MRGLIRVSRTRVAAISVALAVVVSCGIVLYPGASGASPQAAVGPAEASPASSFQLLSDATNTAPPASVAQAVQQAPSGFGLNLAGARQAAGTGVWLIPGESELCLAVDDADGLGMSCASAASAAAGGLRLLERSVNGGSSTVVGVAPNGMTHATAHTDDGATVATVPVEENTYVVSGQGVSGALPSP